MVLERSCLRRKIWEAHLLANSIASALGSPPAGRPDAPTTGDPDDWPVGGAIIGASGTHYRVVSPDAMMSMLGG